MNKINKCWQRGQTIIEATVAMATVLVVLAAISVAVTTSLNNSTHVRSQSLASKYAQEGMETLRYKRNNEAVDFNALSGTYCMAHDSTLSSQGAGGCTVNIPDASLIREAQFITSSGTCSGGTQVTVYVHWSSGKCDSTTLQTRYCHNTKLVSCLSKESSSGSTL